ncbi:hypothetical protein [Haladaptatus sp. DFWS20]|uniref:hypothetical protein n=1 Tax=Haladaptatus sp. DFWS20 TaxID=3403467 RepID=UPI003EBA8D91
MQTTDALLLGILLVLFDGIAILDDVLLPSEWAVGTLWLGLFVGVDGAVFDQFGPTES